MCVWRNVQDTLHQAGNSPGNLLQVPSFFYRQAKISGHRRPRRKIQQKIFEKLRGSRKMSLFRYLHHFVLTATNWALSTSADDEILVGGQAVIEGVMMRSPKGYSVAV